MNVCLYVRVEVGVKQQSKALFTIQVNSPTEIK